MARKSVKNIDAQLARIRNLYQGDKSIPNLARMYRAESIADRLKANSVANSKG